MAIVIRVPELEIDCAESIVLYHEPVMTTEVMDLMKPLGSGLYLDGTVGGGGHSRLLLEMCRECRIIRSESSASSRSRLNPR